MSPPKLKRGGPAKTAEQRQWARRAIRMILDCPNHRGYRRRELFPHAQERWASLLLERLAEAGAIAIDSRGRGAAKLYTVAEPLRLQQYLDDHRLLSHLLWPGRSLDPRTLPTEPTAPVNAEHGAVGKAPIYGSAVGSVLKAARGEAIFAAYGRGLPVNENEEEDANADRGRQLIRTLSLASHLTSAGGADLYALARMFSVTPRTIRRDLEALAAAGVVVEGKIKGDTKTKTWTVTRAAAATLVESGVATHPPAQDPLALAEAQLKLAMGTMEAVADVARALAALQSRVGHFHDMFCDQMGIDEAKR